MAQTIVSSITLDDTSTNVTYVGGNWTTHTNVESIFHLYNNSDSFASDQGATATLKFYGNALEYWGNQGPYHGPCLLTLDGSDIGTVNSNAAADDFPILLYSNNDMELGDHTLVITVNAPAYPNTCEVDRFVVNITSSITYTSAYVYTGPGSVATGAAMPSGSVTSTPPTTKKSSPPVAAIAGAVGGVAVIALLILLFWWLRRSKRNEKEAPPKLLKENTGITQPFLADSRMGSPRMDAEKQGFPTNNNLRPEYPNQGSSYVSSSPPPSSYNPSSPPPSTVGYTYPFGPASTTAAPMAVGLMPSPPNSPQPTTRPMSTVSSAPSMSYYSHGPPTTEGGGFVGFVPQQPVPAINPVWATPAPAVTTAYTQPHQPSPLPSPSPSPAPVPAPVVAAAPAPVSDAATESLRPEKARYTGSEAPPEKAQYRGDAAGTSSGGASSSTAPAVDAAVAGGSGSAQVVRSDTIMSPTVPDAPPPAYQM